MIETQVNINKEGESDLFYKDAQAHLLDELRWLNCLLAARVLELRSVHFYDTIKDFRDFFVTDEEVDGLLAAGIFESKNNDTEFLKESKKLNSQAQNFRKMIDQRVQKSVSQNAFLPLVQLSNCFGLSDFELQALIICLAPQIDTRYEKLYSYLQNDLSKRLPAVDLILALLFKNVKEQLKLLPHFNASAALRHFHLVESIENGFSTTSVQYVLRVDPRIVYYILGNQATDPRISSNFRFLPALEWKNVVVHLEFQNQLQKLFLSTMERFKDQQPVFYFFGRIGVGKKTIAGALCESVGIPLAAVDMRILLQNKEDYQQNIRLILREGLLQPCAICFDHIEILEILNEENPALIGQLIQEINESGWITFLCSEKPIPDQMLDLPMIYPVKIPPPDYVAQKALWEIHLDGTQLENESLDFDKLAQRFDLTGGQVERAVRRAKQFALVREPENTQLTLADLFTSSRIQSQPKLSALARKIEPKYHWDDIVLPVNQIHQLRELADQVKYKQMVMEDWGFINKLSLGQGINALFSGPSGTGKTMAAEVIANDLGLDLYKIDLSAVVSKYIGETEKNLNQVFTEAEHSNCILFFDEADALLGKRSEVKDAHDRYANIEIAYLLQKMEEYKGITILATNLKQNIDEAFTRRIRFIIDFPFPEAIYRRRIWQGIWPKQLPMGQDVDLELIARKFEITGGHIRNIALSAAFYAANDGRAVKMEHLMQAARREFQKMGKLCG